ncbi:ATP-binding protein [Chenggangzhangella methanolivorans]|uniref:histidine kinase n=1 Tax=Chenggangzhangella methanolivorans TaxID=1437009 RepID=A0A9E6RCU5_9HYPH|nr:ATP-binding protein [Chenggangzhangella methanolivorans]QZO00954.1 two-component sensor histidine kinase [Chenggangzhangella methanolivorans]
MNALGVRVAALLTLAILIVVGVATVLALQFLGPPPPPGGPRRAAAQLAMAVRAVERLSTAEFEKLVAGGAVSIGSAPPPGPEIESASEKLEEALRREGAHGEARVVEPAPGAPATAAVRLSDGRWLSIETGPPPGPGRREWLVFAFWLVLIAIGVAGLAAFVVIRSTRPLSVLERAVAAVGPDGEFKALPEEGPPEVRAAARAINQLSLRLKTAMESRMRLVAAAGHDLRTPMTRMRLRAEFLADDEERGKWLADLEELDRIADSAIRLVREEVDPDAPQTADVAKMTSEIAAELSEIGLPVRVTRAAPARALVRPLAMKRALRNLVVNAATHGLSATLSVDVTPDKVVVAIEDEGPGIPPELLERAFEPFFRVDPARKATTPGAGLGLAIAKEIVARNGGGLTIANRPSGGLVQVVTLPLAKAQGDAATAWSRRAS